MAEQTVELVPSESKLVTFEAIPHEARTYQVSVDELTGSFRAIAAPPEVVKLEFTGSLAKGETRYLTTIPSGSTELDITLEATDDIDLELWYWSTKVIGFGGKIDSRGPTTRTYQGDTFAYSGWYGGSEYIRADGPLSRAYTLQVYGHQAGDYTVNVSFLPGPPTPPVPSVEITSITLDKTSLLDWDKFVISITFSNPHDYDVWVRPVFGFGNLIGGEFNVVPALIGLTWSEERGLEPGGSGAEWVDLGIVAIKGSGMTNYIYDPEGIPVVTGEWAYLKVPAKGQATTSKAWWVATEHSKRGPGGLIISGRMFGMIPGAGYVPDWYNYCVVGKEYMVEYFAGKPEPNQAWEVYEPIPRVWDVCVKVEGAFYLVYDPGCGVFKGKTVNYRRVRYEPLPFVGVAEDLVSVGIDHPDWKDDRGYWHRYRWQRYVGTEDNKWILVFEDATPPDWW